MDNKLELESYFGLRVGLEGQLVEKIYYRRFGLRLVAQLVAPRFHPISSLQLPRLSVFHHNPDRESMGISGDDPILQHEKRVLSVEHVLKLTSNKGPPRPRPVQPMLLVRKYHGENRKLKRVFNRQTVLRNPVSPLIVNYGILKYTVRYIKNYMMEYNEWYNEFVTQIDTINEYCNTTNRQQYWPVYLPRQIPSLQAMMRGEAWGDRPINRTLMKLFDSPEKRMVLELWKWLGDNRQNSLLAKFENGNLGRINLVVIESGRWCVINLGVLDSFRKSAENPKGIVQAKQMQRRFLRLMMHALELRTLGPDAEVDMDEETDSTTPITATTIDAKPNLINSSPALFNKNKDESTISLDIDEEPQDESDETEYQTVVDKAIEKDLSWYKEKELDEIVEEDVHIDTSPPPSDEEEEEDTSKIADEFDSTIDEPLEYTVADRSLDSTIVETAKQLAAKGLYSAAELRRITKLANSYKDIKNPFGGNETLDTAAVVTKDDLTLNKEIKLPDSSVVLDKSMLASTLINFDIDYVENVLNKDILRSVLHAAQHAGVALTGYSAVEHEDAMGHYIDHTVQLTPVQGKPSTIHFRTPKINADGTYRFNGGKYRLRKQRSDIPIRKVAPNKVALTSYYNKTFINRSEKKVHLYPQWLCNKITAIGLDDSDNRVSKVMLEDVFDSYIKNLPRTYTTLATRFRSFSTKEIDFYLDHATRLKHFGEASVKLAEKGNHVVIAKKGNKLVTIDDKDILHCDGAILGTIETIVGLEDKAPIEIAEFKVINKQIPLGFVMAYLLGLDKLLELLKTKVRRVGQNERLNLKDDEYAVRFANEYLILDRKDRVSTLLLAGFNVFEKSIKNYPIQQFNKKDIYRNVLESARIGPSYLRECDNFNMMFIDPITKSILEEMKEPTNVIGLMLRSCQLLTTDWSPSEVDMHYMRIRGYERIAGACYSGISKAIKLHRSKTAISRSKIEINPFEIWNAITQDSANKIVEDSNPIHSLKEVEEVTFGGTGGRTGRSMVVGARLYQEQDLGIISEGTKDSSDVAVVTYMSMNPQLTNLYGMVEDNPDKDPAHLMSTTALLCPASDRDDSKRTLFSSIQMSSNTFAEGYEAMPLRTGAESIIAHRCNDLFAVTAKKKGKVESVTDKAVTVIYKDGSKESFEIGRRYGTVAGSTLPHEIKTIFKAGDSFNEGDCLTYNSNYFALDPINPRQAIMKMGVMARTVLMDSSDTLEDSSAISEKMAQKLSTKISYVRDITLNFDQTVHNLINVGDSVDSDTVLCIIEDVLTANSAEFDSENVDTLRLLAANSPKAKHKGLVERIEVFYNGELEDIPEPVQELIAVSNRNRKRLARELNRKYSDGRVDESLRLDGKGLPKNHLVIRVYITSHVGTGSGDKGVFANQLKTIFRRVLTGKHETESGKEIDAIFSYASVNNRIVDSPIIIGTTNTLLKLISQKMAKAYFE